MGHRLLARLASLAFLYVATAVPVHAVPLVAGSPLAFNFDFTSAPSFDGARVSVNWTPALAPGQSFSMNVYDDPDAVGFVFGFINFAGDEGGFTWQNSATADGIFSIQLSVNVGSVDLTSLVLELVTYDPDTGYSPLSPPVRVTLVPASVPEPDTLWLLAVALAGLGVARRSTHRRPERSARACLAS